MKPACGWLALLTVVLGGADLRAQGVLVPAPYAGGYMTGGGPGFAYQRGGLSVGGFLGGRPGVLVGPYGPVLSPYPVTGYGTTRVTVTYYLPPGSVQMPAH